jgi:hypothetical protein
VSPVILMTHDRRAEPLSLSAALARLLLVALIVSQVILWVRMSARDEWLTYAVVVSAPLALNMRLDDERLHYEVRWMERALRPIGTKADAAGKFLTPSAIARCRQNSCADLPLIETDVADRPAFGLDAEVFKASIGEPWRVSDIRVGDHVYVVAGGASAPAGRGERGGGAAGRGEAVVPDAGARGSNVPAPDSGGAAPDPEPVDAIEMIVVGIAAAVASNSASSVFLVPAASIATEQLRQFRTRGVRVTSVRMVRENAKPVDQTERSKSQ